MSTTDVSDLRRLTSVLLGTSGEVDDALVDLAGLHGALELLVAGAPPLDPRTAATVAHHRFGLAQRRTLICEELAVVSRCLDDHGIDHLVIKGPALALELHGTTAAREYRDLDLFVDVPDFDAATTALATVGFEIESDQGWRRSLHRAHSFLTVDVHAALSPWFDDEGMQFAELWARRITSHGIVRPDSVDHCLILASQVRNDVHRRRLAVGRPVELRRFLDELGPARWPELVERAEAADGGRTLGFALAVTNELTRQVGLDVPAGPEVRLPEQVQRHARELIEEFLEGGDLPTTASTLPPTASTGDAPSTSRRARWSTNPELPVVREPDAPARDRGPAPLREIRTTQWEANRCLLFDRIAGEVLVLTGPASLVWEAHELGVSDRQLRTAAVDHGIIEDGLRALVDERLLPASVAEALLAPTSMS